MPRPGINVPGRNVAEMSDRGHADADGDQPGRRESVCQQVHVFLSISSLHLRRGSPGAICAGASYLLAEQKKRQSGATAAPEKPPSIRAKR